jgi:hypothetical protein
MAGLVPAIYVLVWSKDVDARHKAGHDEGEAVPAPLRLLRKTEPCIESPRGAPGHSAVW